MGRHKSIAKVDEHVQIDKRWNGMLSDIQRAIDATRVRLSDLEQSALIVREKITSGEPFPEVEPNIAAPQ